ncbi:hypothetical protein BZG36_03450 [Bifiguratus adelaidae]|uniref:Serine/threonine-protein phosphatase 2A activator n=1 Tax=Bifiguratus adelaidae TaxID=1938954 RepID=A0A261XY20_9FUNG|nr:hypothetical protein BZG36_03450 [Bifiguratus adelaidae]
MSHPVRKILTQQDLAAYQESPAYHDYITLITDLNASVIGVKTDDPDIVESPRVKQIVALLETLTGWIKEIPPQDNKLSRFGNPAFRLWYDRVKENLDDLHRDLIPEHHTPEVSAYLLESFGNRRRIDYGTGHEANFMAWLLCLKKLGVLTESDHQAMVLRVFVRYIALMRNLQFTYWLEPAGSHGVWGLDDYHFLPFLFGSAQLLGHKYLRPKSIHDEMTVEEFSRSYMYLACIAFINSIKTSASLRWHSPMLDDISSVKTWQKVNEGMIKMYKAEVLGKLPIMQHFLFGTLLVFDGGTLMDGQDDEEEEHHHHHAIDVTAKGQLAPDCCGIPVPSAIASASHRFTINADGRVNPKPGRVPFD